MKDIKLFVSVFRDRADSMGDIVPVSAGAALYGENDVMLSLRDDGGDSISEKNPQYCELTVQYYVWKNLSFDAAGLMHQRRYFDLHRVYPVARGKKPVSARPYRIFDKPDAGTVEKLGLDHERLCELLSEYPVIAPLRENIYQSVRDYYNKNDRRQFDDLALLKEVIDDICPQYSGPAEEYLSSRYAYFCNMLIMDRERFCDYSEWLFSVLSEYERRKPQQYFCPREQGKLAERLFGVYMAYLTDCTDIPCAEAPRAHFAGLAGTTARNPSFNKKYYALFPPGSWRRGLLRKIK